VRSTSREIDICGRYGGEEFAVILPGTPKEGAYTFCERLRTNVAQQSVSARGEPVQFTISLGIAGLDRRQATTAHDWLEQADQALYRAKTSGRNQTQIFG